MDSAKIYRLEMERGRTVIHYEGRLISFARDLCLNVYGDIYEFTLYYNQRVLEEFSLKVIYTSNNWVGQIPINMDNLIWCICQLCRECDHVNTIVYEIARRYSALLSPSALKFVNSLFGKHKIFLHFE